MAQEKPSLQLLGPKLLERVNLLWGILGSALYLFSSQRPQYVSETILSLTIGLSPLSATILLFSATTIFGALLLNGEAQKWAHAGFQLTRDLAADGALRVACVFTGLGVTAGGFWATTGGTSAGGICILSLVWAACMFWLWSGFVFVGDKLDSDDDARPLGA